MNFQLPTQPHVCFSGSLSCSGCMPCDACAMVVKQNVAIAGLKAEQTALIGEIQMALAERRAVNLHALLEAFFRGWAEGWRALHEGMKQEPADQRPYAMIDVGAMLAAAEAYRQSRVNKKENFQNLSTTPMGSAKNVRSDAGVATSSVQEAPRVAPPEEVVFRPEVIIPSAEDIERMEQAARLTDEDIFASATVSPLDDST